MTMRLTIDITPPQGMGLAPIYAAIGLLFCLGILGIAIALWPSGPPSPAPRAGVPVILTVNHPETQRQSLPEPLRSQARAWARV